MVLAGLERADTGSIMVAGEDLRRARRGRAGALPRPQCRHRLPVLPPDPDHDRAGECRGAARTGRRRPTPSDRAREELAKVGLAERLHHYPAQLSGGEQQRVALARALAPNPAILVADEPTGNLDETTGKQVIDLLFAGHVERGTTLILVTHDTALAQRCDRIVRLRSGRIEDARPTAARIMTATTSSAHASNRVPLWLKLAYTAFMIGAGAGLLALLRPDQLPVLLRRRAVPHAGRHLDRQPAADLDVRGRHPRAAGAVGRWTSCSTSSACRSSA